jgi:uncharacterized phage protein (TIGR01671 family)
MREIKFRQWSGTEMIHFSFKDIVGSGKSATVCIPEHSHFQCVQCEEEENHYIMQFTGLKDNNGKDIYEGDILNIYYKTNNGFGLGVVYWSDHHLGFYTKNKDGVETFMARETEVIGNIHENPELLK